MWIRMLGVVLLAWNLGLSSCDYAKRRQYHPDGVLEENNDNFGTSRYKFAYGVEDHKTGDFKMHQEERDGDLVKGEYTVADADGTLRTVRYTADKHNGFHAVISKASDSRQEVVAVPSYQRAVRVLAASGRHHHHRHHRDEHGRDDMRHEESQPRFAKYAARHAKPLHNLATDGAAHYQSVNIANDGEQASYEYNVSQLEKQRGERQRAMMAHAPHAKKAPKVLEVYDPRPPVFQMQTPHGFRKSEQSETRTTAPVALPVALPLLAHPVHEDANEETESDGHHRQGSVVSDEELDWRHADVHGHNDRPLKNYRQIFEAHFGKFPRPPSSTHSAAAFSYVNFEGDTQNGYELHHNPRVRDQHMHSV